jgi:hypothetical protein
MLPHVSPILVAVLLGAALVLAAAFGWILQRTLRRRRLRAQVLRAQVDEQRAVGLLRRAGFRVYGQQVQRTYAVSVDGEPHKATVRADLLAARGRRRYVVEVKTGKVARPTLATTRRQLLEYLLAFGVDGVMLADMERSRLHRVEFDATLPRRNTWALAGALATGLLTGLLIALL